jgi:hypothetical protein
VGFVVDKVALGQVFSEYFGLLSTNYSTITIIHHLGWYIRPIVTAVPSELSLTPLRIIKRNDTSTVATVTHSVDSMFLVEELRKCLHNLLARKLQKK